MIRKLDRDAFEYNDRDSDGDFHEVFADNIRLSPYYIPQLDLVAVTCDGIIYLGHAIFSALPMGDHAEHIVWLNSLAVKHGENDNHTDHSYEYQRKGVGTALVLEGLTIAKSLGYTGCMTCGHPAVYQKKMGFVDCRDLGISREDSVDDPEGAVHAIELIPNGFDKTNKLLSYAYYDFAKTEDIQIKEETLTRVLSKKFGARIIRANYQTRQLQGGTLGDVRLVRGMAQTAGGEKLSYSVVLKVQKKWERDGDHDSWRREYDLYMSDFGMLFTDSFRWPTCYHAEMNKEENEIQLWMEYIKGVSGSGLTIEMLEQAALEIGRFQGRLHVQAPALLQHIENLNTPDYLKAEYMTWTPQTKTYRYLRNEDCTIPEHLRLMIIETDKNADDLFDKIKKLPVVFCHQDFWIENIFYTDGGIRIIDWDTAGWGYMGEDIAALIADDIDYANMDEYYRRCIPAYYKGIAEYMDVSNVGEHCIREVILLRFGYRFVRGYMNARSAGERAQCVVALQKIYEMGESQ